MSSTVKFLHSAIPGAPVLNGTAGALKALLDASLVNGWGSETVTSIVIVGGVATVTKSGHPFEPDMVSLIAGATVTGGTINGQRKVLSSSASAYTFAATGLPDQTATGTITHKVAPLGWTKPHADDGNTAAYRMDNVTGSGAWLRVPDTGTQECRVSAFLTMSDVHTGTGQWSTASGGSYWPKSASADSAARAWTLVGDDRGFVLHSLSMSNAWVAQAFGDLASRKSPDAYRAALVSPLSSSYASGSTASDLACVGSSAGGISVARGPSGIGGGIAGNKVGGGPWGTSAAVVWSGGTSVFFFYPNGPDNALLLYPICMHESGGYRGDVRGAYFCPQSIVNVFANRDVVEGVDLLPGRRLRALSTAGAGSLFVDVTGPWG